MIFFSFSTSSCATRLNLDFLERDKKESNFKPKILSYVENFHYNRFLFKLYLFELKYYAKYVERISNFILYNLFTAIAFQNCTAYLKKLFFYSNKIENAFYLPSTYIIAYQVNNRVSWCFS
jgi:hypothetical protein